MVERYYTKTVEQLLKSKHDNMTSPKINVLQLLQQNLENVVAQKQQVQVQLMELESALKELNNTDKAYKIIGKIMFSSPKESIIKELSEKKEIAEVRIKNFKQQEERLQQNVEEIQKEVMEELKQEKKE